MATTLTPEVRDLLARAECAGNALHLPPGQLDRKTYVAVNDAIEAIGGKWNKKAKAHVFGGDPGPLVDGLLTSGVKPPKNPDAFFPTPSALAERMVALAGGSTLNTPHVRLLEPSAGEGAIAEVMWQVAPNAKTDVVEIDPVRAERLRAWFFNVVEGDFLEFAPAYRYDAILMNPPFAVEGDALAYITHIRHAHTLLDASGLLVAIAPAGLTFREDRRTAEFRAFVLAHGGKIEPLPPKTFVESGTSVGAVLVTIHPAVPSTGVRDNAG